MKLSVTNALSSAPNPADLVRGLRDGPGARRPPAALPALVPVLEELSTLIDRMHASLVQLEATAHTLATVAEPLQGAAERLGRFTDRLPRRGQ